MLHDRFPDDPAALAAAPITAAMIQAGIAAQPEAAAVLLDLLDQIDLANPAGALIQESLAYARLQGSAAHTRWLDSRTPTKPLPDAGRVATARIGDVVEMTLDRADTHNAVDRAIRDALFEGFSVAAHDPEVAAVRLRGAGKAFCVGADLDEFGTTRDPAKAHAIRMATLPAHAIVQCAARFEAHVQGACIGAGLEMVAFARGLTATRDAWFQLPELMMGLIPGAGGCVSMPRRIGRRRTAAMVLSGRRIGARTALRWGLIDAIMDDDPLDEGRTHNIG